MSVIKARCIKVCSVFKYRDCRGDLLFIHKSAINWITFITCACNAVYDILRIYTWLCINGAYDIMRKAWKNDGFIGSRGYLVIVENRT